MTKTVLGTLKRARKLIANGRWTKGNYSEVKPKIGLCFCAAGAVKHVVTGKARGSSTLAVESFIELSDDPRLKQLRRKYTAETTVTVFNDHPTRTREQVVALFDRTIARLEKRAA